MNPLRPSGQIKTHGLGSEVRDPETRTRGRAPGTGLGSVLKPANLRVSLFSRRHHDSQRFPQLRADGVAGSQVNFFAFRSHYSSGTTYDTADRRSFSTSGDAADDRPGSGADGALLDIAFGVGRGLPRDTVGLYRVALTAHDDVVEAKRDGRATFHAFDPFASSTDPVIFEPAGTAVRPSTTIDLAKVPLIGSSTWLVSDAIAVARVTASNVSAGIVTS